MAGEEYKRRLNSEIVRLLEGAGYEWQGWIPGFHNRHLGVSIRYEEVQRHTPGTIVHWITEQQARREP